MTQQAAPSLPPGGAPTTWDGVYAYDNTDPGMRGAYQVPNSDEDMSGYARAHAPTVVVDPHDPASAFTIQRPPAARRQPTQAVSAEQRARAAAQMRQQGALGLYQPPDDNGARRLTPDPRQGRQQARQQPAPVAPQRGNPAAPPAQAQRLMTNPATAPAPAPRQPADAVGAYQIPPPDQLVEFDLTPTLPEHLRQDPLAHCYHLVEFQDDRLLLQFDTRYGKATGHRCWFPRTPAQQPIVVTVRGQGPLWVLPLLRLAIGPMDVCVLQPVNVGEGGPEPDPEPHVAGNGFADLSSPPDWAATGGQHSYAEPGEAAPAAAGYAGGILEGQTDAQGSGDQAGPHYPGAGLAG